MKTLMLSAASLLVLASPACVSAQEPAAPPASPPHWDYVGADPQHWNELDKSFATCGTGKVQSPIDIHAAKKAPLDPIEFHYKPALLNIVDNGHTVMANYAPGSTITVGGHAYTLKQFHFHHPAEEEFNGHAAEMEVHLVHADTEGKLAVVSVSLKAGTPNPVIEQMWTNLPKEKGVSKAVENAWIDAGELIPAQHGYYTFSGSLTTPPCSENVTWFVLKAPKTVSKDEVAAFAKVYPMNARPPQPLNGRTVLESR
jgi:carbonic anhydrase